MRWRALAAALPFGLALHCAPPRVTPSSEPWSPTRWDYGAFREAHSQVRDPNYLPFMAHRFRRDGEDLLLLCRWDDDAFPLAVHVEPPTIAKELEDEFDPKPPEAYVEAVQEALASWARRLPGVIRFRRVERAEQARLRVRLEGAVGPLADPDVQVLGMTPVTRACRVEGGDPASGRLRVAFEVSELRIFVADRFGLLPPDQVERLALHELGHALGMRGHSPIPADLMYEQARDRTVGHLSEQDVNSFASLYRMPNGTIYLRFPRGSAPARRAPTAPVPVELDATPWEDARHGYAVRLPASWLRFETRQGVVIVDGVAWDYEASLQIIARRYRSIEGYLEQHLAAHVGRGVVAEQDEQPVAGRNAFHMVVEKPAHRLVEEHTFVETGDGRVLVVIAEAPAELHAGFAPWFRAVLESLEIRALAPGAHP